MNDSEAKTLHLCQEIFEEYKWYAVPSVIKNSFTKEDFINSYMCAEIAEFISQKIDNENTYSMIIEHLLKKFSSLAYDILDNGVNEQYKLMLIKHGIFRDISDIDKLVDSSSKEVRRYAVKKCSLGVLKGLTKDPDKMIRREAYRRLGVIEHLDEMLEDKNMEVRLLAARKAPIGYYKFKEMKDEKSNKVFREIAKKINQKEIPYLLGNRNAKDPYVKKVLSSRLVGSED